MTDAVLDASAVLAVLNNEAGAEKVYPYLRAAVLSTVNLGEIVAKLVERGMPAQLALEAIEALSPDIVPFSQDQAVQAGALRTVTRSGGLSFGDRCCLAVALELGVPVVTADRAWLTLDIGADVRLIR